MVKNNTGGNKAKQKGRKFSAPVNNTAAVRKAKEADEMYAVVSKVLGGRYCQVLCLDGVSRRCTIRKKFTARRTGDNQIASGVWVLVGLYDWASAALTCDLLEIYSAAEKEKLKQSETCNFASMLGVGDTSEVDVGFSEHGVKESSISSSSSSSSSEEEEEDDLFLKPQEAAVQTQTQEKPQAVVVKEQMDWINVDDI
jgi:translation initiation factor IF-1